MFSRPGNSPDVPASIQVGSLPAPIAGINSIASLAEMTSKDAIYTVNIDATTYGLRVRPGFTIYGLDLFGTETRTIMPFNASGPSYDNAIFAATDDGIYYVGSPDINPGPWAATKVVDFPIKSGRAGWCSFAQFTNDNGEHVLLVCDEENGLYAYTESTGLWTQPSVTGPTGILCFVMIWKSRVWYIEKETASAWYTDLGTFAGTATKFNFGNKFRAGGQLVGLYDWTRDSGNGPNDFLVSVSSAGDVVAYNGIDPADPDTFGLVGIWFIGALPAGRRVGSQYGGDLLLLSIYGLISCNDLLRGSSPFTVEGSMSWKIQTFLATQMRQTRTMYGWEVKLHPNLSKIIVASPKTPTGSYTQFVYDVDLQAWSIWEDVPMLTSEEFLGESFFGSVIYPYHSPLSMWRITGHLDFAEYEPERIQWKILTAYSDFGAPERWKIVGSIRPVFLSDLVPALNVRAFFDYDLSRLADPSDSGQATWDSALWDEALWGLEIEPRQANPTGASGMGRAVAVAIAGSSQAETTLVSIGLTWQAGGPW